MDCSLQTKLLFHHCWQQEPFFSQLLAQIQKRSNCDIKSPAIISFPNQSICLDYNPILLFDYCLSDQAIIIFHELLHLINAHHLRWQDRNPVVWNVATDLAVNSFLVNKMSPRLQQEVLLPSKWALPDHKSAEWYYASLQNKDLKNVLVDHSVWYQHNSSPDLQSILHHASQVAKAPMIAESSQSSLDWNKFLGQKLRWVYGHGKTYHARKFSRRYGRPPGKTRKKILSKIAVVLDTSSSINLSILKMFIQKVQQLASQLQVSLLIIECDDQVQRCYPYSQANFDLVAGGGSTAFSPALDYISKMAGKQSIGAIVYFTDGESSETEIFQPKIPVFWVYPNSSHHKPVEWGYHLCLN